MVGSGVFPQEIVQRPSQWTKPPKRNIKQTAGLFRTFPAHIRVKRDADHFPLNRIVPLPVAAGDARFAAFFSIFLPHSGCGSFAVHFQITSFFEYPSARSAGGYTYDCLLPCSIYCFDLPVAGNDHKTSASNKNHRNNESQDRPGYSKRLTFLIRRVSRLRSPFR